MSDYKSDQDRFFQKLRDLEDIAKATKEEQRLLIDGLVKKLVKIGGPVEGWLEPPREIVIQALKKARKLPLDYTYPEDPTID